MSQLHREVDNIEDQLGEMAELAKSMLENGVKVMVPPFIGAGEKIVVDTGELTYVRRAD